MRIDRCRMPADRYSRGCRGQRDIARAARAGATIAVAAGPNKKSCRLFDTDVNHIPEEAGQGEGDSLTLGFGCYYCSG